MAARPRRGNLGISAASGDFIALLDSDDLWVEEKLARQMAVMEACPETALLFSEAWMFREEGGERIPLQRIGYTGDPSLRQLLFGDFIPNSTVLMRRECVESIGPLNEKRELIGSRGLRILDEDRATIQNEWHCGTARLVPYS
jgi:glycosyltransferase involved in cell wall biosynthesis